MGNFVGKSVSEIPSKPELVFQSPIPASKNESIVSFNNVTIFMNTILSFVSLLEATPLAIPAKLLTIKDTGDKILSFLGNSQELIKIFVEDKVQESEAKIATSILNAKLDVIKTRRNRMLNSEVSISDKKDEVVPALSLCQEVLNLYLDETYPLHGTIPFAEHFLKFVGIYSETILLSCALKESYRKESTATLSKIEAGVEDYKVKCLKERYLCAQCKVTYSMSTETYSEEKEIQQLLNKVTTEDAKWFGGVNSNWDPTAMMIKHVEFWDEWPSYVDSSEKYTSPVAWIFSIRTLYARGSQVKPSGSEIISALKKFQSYKNKIQPMYAKQFDDTIDSVRKLRRSLLK